MWITIQEAATRRDVSTRTIRRMISAGLIEAERFGPRLIRVNAVSLEHAGRSLVA
ncbi:excisionase family DNA-binding protein [Agromyces aureus]|uniref:excisionase family DNA-binding protein n=1 Tax=Agromyces aureus TaxID=453304 RepID=UPI0009FC332A|nr:excisionase family DNA-binding protein [Agromyces aureus]